MWCLTTMGRPTQCAAVLKAMVDHGMSTPGIVVVNGPERADEYRQIVLPDQWQIEFLPENIGLCASFNRMFSKFPNEPWYGAVCDDEFIFTEGFDQTLVQHAGSWCVAHANDGWQSEKRIHTFAVHGGELLRFLGWWALPGLWHWYFDDVIETIAGELDLRRFCKDVRSEHRHWCTGAATFDDVYRLGESRSEQDREVFLKWKTEEWPRTKERLSQRILEANTHGN